MAPKKMATFRIDDELLEGIQEVWTRDGVQPSEQVRRAIRAWLESKGVVVKTAKPTRGKRTGKA